MKEIGRKILLFTNSDWTLANFRLPLARYLRRAGYEVVLASPPGEFIEPVRREGFTHRVVPMTRTGFNAARELLSLGRLAVLYRREAPDLVHNFTPKGVLYGSTAARLAGVEHVVNSITGRGAVFVEENVFAGTSVVDRFKENALRALLGTWFRLALPGTQLIFQNPDDRTFFRQSGFIGSSQSVHLIRCSGVDTEQIDAAEPEEGPPVVVLAARMIGIKGVREYVQAAHLLKERSVTACFVLVGKVDENHQTAIPEQQLRAWQEEGLVEWWGFQDDMNAVFAQSHVVCLPSTGPEGFPKVLAEAGAAARPVVTTDVPGCRAAVRPEETGLVVPPKDAGALADALQRLLEDKSLRRRMGRRGHQFVEENFSMKHVAEKTVQVYQTCRAGKAN
jgi:glycosyltransferase involved in cell wall biosynthesis